MVLVVFLGRTANDKDVVNVGKAEIQVSKEIVHETLEALGMVSYAKGHKGKFEKAERCGECGLLDYVRVNRDLVVSPYEVYFGKGGAAGKAVGVFLYVWNCVPVRNSASVECSVVATVSTTAVILGHEMEGGRHSPRRVGLYRSAAWRRIRPWPRPSEAARTAGYRRGGCYPDVCCDVFRDGSQSVWSAPGIPPGSCLGACLLR